jgi:predicted dinucleotide-binding enzyme
MQCSTKHLFRGLRGKIVLRTAMSTRLPEEVKRHKKWGFGVPWAQYLRKAQPFRSLVEALPSRFPATLMDQRETKNRIRLFLAGDDGQSSLVRQMLFVHVWHEAIVEKKAVL